MRWVYPLVIAIACAATYSNVFDGPFVFDDIPSIARNVNIRSLTPLASAAGIGLKDDITIAGRPLPALTFAANYAISGLHIWSYRLGNLLIHIAAALLLFGILRRTLASPPCAERFAAHADPLAFCVALLWAVHPLQPTSVTYVVQRVESLMGLFALLTLYAAIRAASSPRTAAWSALAILACMLGMTCKEGMVVVPVLVLLYDRIFLAGGFVTALRSRTALYVGLAASWIVLALLVLTSPRAGIAAGLANALSPLEYLRIQMWAIPHYLRLCFWPAPLTLDYGNTTVGVDLPTSLPVVAVGAALLVALGIGTLVALLKNRPVGFLGAWFFLLLAPSSSLIPLPFEPAAEHRMYLPLAAVLSLAVLCLYRVLRSATARLPVAITVSFIAAAALCVCTYQRNALFRDEVQLWSADAQHNPTNVRVQTNLALAHTRAGNVAGAMEHYQAALRLRPADPEALFGMGNALLGESRFEESAAYSRRAIEARPRFAEALSILGEALRYLDRAAEAIPYFQKSLEIDASSGATHAGLADALAIAGRCAAAEPHYRQALAMIPDDPAVHLHLARCLAVLNRRAEAIEQLRAACRRWPEIPELRSALAELQGSR